MACAEPPGQNGQVTSVWPTTPEMLALRDTDPRQVGVYELRGRLGEWDSEWSLRHMLQVLRRAILNATIDPDSANEAELRDMVQTLKNWANLAA